MKKIVNKNYEKRFSIKRILLFALLALIIALPNLNTFWKIKEIYFSAPTREIVLDSIFYLRETYGLTIGDLTIKEVIDENDKVTVKIHEKYHGFVKQSKYTDLERDYFVGYDKNEKTFSTIEIKETTR